MALGVDRRTVTKGLGSALTALLSLTAAGESKAGSPSVDGDIRDIIWAKEIAIFAGRAKGDMGPYVSMVHPAFLAWPALTESPTPAADFIARNSVQGALPPGEQITLKSDGMSVHGGTVVSYFTTHRTVRPGGKKVDERFENVHVWLNHDDDWKVIASMSRQISGED